MTLKMNNSDVNKFCRENQQAMLILVKGVDDYIACRCCLLNGLFPGLVIAAQAIEKVLKGYLYLNKNPNPRIFKHNLSTLTKEVEKYADYGLAKFLPLMDRLEKHYLTRYHDNKDASTCMSTGELNEIDELFVHLIERYPIPDEVKFRSGLYVLMFKHIERNQPFDTETHWIIYNNKAISDKYGELKLRYCEIYRHLFC